MLTIDDAGIKRNIFATSDKKKIGYSQIQKWIEEYVCVILDYKCLGIYKDEPVALPVALPVAKVTVASLPDVMLFGNIYRATLVKDCTECVFFNDNGGCGVKEFNGKGRNHCQKTYGYKRIG